MITPESVKRILQLKNENHDEYLNEVIPLVEEFAKEYCNNPFEEIPSGVKLFVAKACEYLMNQAGVNSRGMGAVSYSYEMDFPPSLLRLIKPYKRLKFV